MFLKNTKENEAAWRLTNLYCLYQLLSLCGSVPFIYTTSGNKMIKVPLKVNCFKAWSQWFFSFLFYWLIHFKYLLDLRHRFTVVHNIRSDKVKTKRLEKKETYDMKKECIPASLPPYSAAGLSQKSPTPGCAEATGPRPPSAATRLNWRESAETRRAAQPDKTRLSCA